MEFDTLELVIFPLPPSPSLEGALNKNNFKEHTYTLVIDETMSLNRIIRTIAHEFVHVQQYEHGGLEIFGDIWVWNPDGLPSKQGITWGSLTYTEYRDRAFEIEAYEKQWAISRQVTRYLKQRNLLAKYR